MIFLRKILHKICLLTCMLACTSAIYVSKLAPLKWVLRFLVYLLHDFCAQKLYFHRRGTRRANEMQDYISEKPGFSCGVTKRNFLRRERRVDEFSLKIFTAVKIALRTDVRQNVCSLQQQQQQLVKCEIVMDRRLPLLFRSDLPRPDRIYVSRYSNLLRRRIPLHPHY